MTEQVHSVTFGELMGASGDGFDPQLIEFFKTNETLVYQVRRPALETGEPPGVLIYLSPKAGARMPDGWGQVLDQHNLMWVGAQDAGNEVHVARRVGFALLAPALAARVTGIDVARTYLAGFSGGGRVASMMMPVYPSRFAGAIFICGANPLFTVTQDAINALAPLPLIFLTGTGDFNLADTQMAIATFRQAGMANAHLMVVDGLGHALPEGEDLEAALGLATSAGSTT